MNISIYNTAGAANKKPILAAVSILLFPFILPLSSCDGDLSPLLLRPGADPFYLCGRDRSLLSSAEFVLLFHCVHCFLRILSHLFRCL